jgi:DNA (cytosine-5)-methyltransferase 1
MIQVGSDFSGVGAFNQALMRLNIEYKEAFACDMDKYARETFIHNYGEPSYYPENVYDREIPKQSLDIYMTSPPCQAFSLAGKRKGEDDKRGVLFYNSHEFIQVNKPRYFIFENVKGLLSDDGGKTFQRWLDYLGGKSVNGNPVIFPLEDATPYHIYHQVLNAKDYGVPQNRERVFIIGIRDDEDNEFSFPKPFHLTKRLKDVLEADVDEKYYLSNKAIKHLIDHKEKHDEKGTGFGVELKNEDSIASTLRANGALCPTDNHIKVKSATKKGYETATDEDSINFSVPNSETRRGRVGKGVAQTLDTSCNQAVLMGAIRGRNPENPLSREVGLPTEQRLELNMNGTSNALTTVQKDNVVVYGNLKGGKWDKTHEQSGRVYNPEGIGATIHTMGGGNQEPKIVQDYQIRKLTPRECFRLMDFPDTFTWTVSDSQAYKQAGNSIVVNVLAEILKKLNL